MTAHSPISGPYLAAPTPHTTHSLATNRCKSTNVPSGTRFFGPSGEILILQIDYTRGWMALWNSTDCGLQNAVIGTPDYGSWGNTAHGNAQPTPSNGLGPGLNGTNPRCYSWNVTIPKGLGTTSGIGRSSTKDLR